MTTPTASEIRLEFIYTKEEAAHGNSELLSSLRPTRFPRLRLVGRTIFGIVLLAIAADLIIGRGFHPTDVLLIFAGIAIILIQPFLRWLSIISFQKLPAANKPVRWTISAERLTTEVEGNRSSFDWRSIIKARESKHGFLLFPGPRLGHWLPMSAFASDTEKEQLRSWIQAHQIEFKRT